MNQLKRFFLSLLLILFVIITGTAGYYYIEGWDFFESLYMTVITISTVGFKEVHPLSESGMKFTMVFISLSIFTIGYTVTTLISFIFGGQIFHAMKERRMKHFLTITKDHYIICGFGSVGKETAEEFQKKKVRFVIIEKDIENIDKSRYSDYLFVEGDASEEEILTEAKISKAKGLISCLPDDQQNVFVVLTARQLNPTLLIVSKSSDERTIKKLKKAGANKVISPQQIAGKRMAAISLQPSIVDFLDVLSGQNKDSLRIESISVSKDSPLIGKSLRKSNIGQFTGAIVLGIMDSEGQTRTNPTAMASLASIEINQGDNLLALGSEEQILNLKKFVKE